MSTYTFTSSSCYALSTHEVTFTSTKVKIVLTSTGQTVYHEAFTGAGKAFMCQSNDFCVGTLSDNGVFSKTVDFANTRAELWLVEQSGQNKFIGSDDESDPSVFNKYDLNQCPIRLVSKSNVVTIECPCESSSGPCDNDCYTYG